MDKTINAIANLAEALRDNGAAVILLDLIFWIVVFFFAYYLIRMIIDKCKESTTNRVLSRIERTLDKNVEVLGKVVQKLESL